MDSIKGFIKNIYDQHFKWWAKKTENALLQFRQETIKKDNKLFSPVIFVLAAIMAIISGAVALGSLISMFCSLLVLYFILSQIFGLNLNLADVVVV